MLKIIPLKIIKYLLNFYIIESKFSNFKENLNLLIVRYVYSTMYTYLCCYVHIYDIQINILYENCITVEKKTCIQIS